MVLISIKKLANMIANKCKYCEFKEGQCSEKNGCETGIFNFLNKEYGSYEVCDSESGNDGT